MLLSCAEIHKNNNNYNNINKSNNYKKVTSAVTES